GHGDSAATGKLDAVLRPVRIGYEHFVARTHGCHERRHNCAGATHSDDGMLWANRVAIDALGSGGYQLSQPRPAGGRAIGDGFALNTLDGGLANVFRGAKTGLAYLQAYRWRQHFAARLCLALQLLRYEAQGCDVVDGQVVDVLL